MKLRFFFFLSFMFLMNSCGPIQEEIQARERFIADSTKVYHERVEAERIHKEKIEVGKSIKRTQLSNMLDDLKARLQKERIELGRISEFQIGRFASTKELQLRNQNATIARIENVITKVEKEISLTNLHNSFDFQTSPSGTVEHFFVSARSGDFSKLRHLLDPYGEYEKEMLGMCMIEMLPDNAQQEWVNNFENGRVIGNPVIQDDHAEVEIAYGPSSNKLEKIKLVQRLDKWYVQGM